MQKLADIRGAHKIIQVQFGDSLAQINPEVLIVKHAELLAVSSEQIVAVLMKSGDLQTRRIYAAQFLAHSFAHLLDSIFCISDRQNFVGSSVAVAD